MTTLKQGDKAPNFSALDQDGKSHKLADYKGKKLVVFFYPKASTPGCTAEACDLRDNFNKFEEEAKRCIAENLVHPAYDYILKCSHNFNLLDARGAVSVTERAGYLARIRNLSREIAKIFVEERAKLGYPLLSPEEAQKWLEEEK